MIPHGPNRVFRATCDFVTAYPDIPGFICIITWIISFSVRLRSSGDHAHKRSEIDMLIDVHASITRQRSSGHVGRLKYLRGILSPLFAWFVLDA